MDRKDLERGGRHVAGAESLELLLLRGAGSPDRAAAGPPGRRLPAAPGAPGGAGAAREPLLRSGGDRPHVPPGGSGPLRLRIPDYRSADSPPSSADSTPSPSPAPPGASASAGAGAGPGAVDPRRRGDRRLRRLNTELLDAIEIKDFEWAEKSLNNGANPNATCRLDYVSACHFASAMGSDRILAMLINRGAEKTRMDRLGRTPLHLAAWGGHTKCVAILLHFPETLQNQVDGALTKQIERDVKYCCSQLRDDLVNVRCKAIDGKMQLSKEWKDSFDHDCRDIQDFMPLIGEGSTPLHVAALRARPHSTRLLLVAGADVHALDERGHTPLDVLGAAYYQHSDQLTPAEFLEVLKMLLESGGSQKTMCYGGIGVPATPLHTAVELDCSDAIRELLAISAYPGVFNEAGDTPLHTCVRRRFVEPLQVLCSAGDGEPLQQPVDLKNARGYTALHASVADEWIPGVSTTLEAGADVAVQAYDGDTAIHVAATLGDPDLLLEVLSVAKSQDAIDCVNAVGETALFKAIVLGHIDCVRALMREGASVTKTMPGEMTTLHRAAEFGRAEILQELLIANKRNFSNIKIDALCDEKRQGFSALHYAALNDHKECVKVLLAHGADVRLRSTVEPHVQLTALHVAAMLGHTSVAEVIIAFDKNTVHQVDGHGWLPIHTAAHHGSRDAIPPLLQAGADLSSTTDGHTGSNRSAIDILVNNITRPTDYLEELFDSYISVNEMGAQDSNYEVQVDYSVLMPKNLEIEQMQVIVALIKSGNRYGQRRLLLHPLVESFLFLKWQALAPFFYAILVMYSMFVASLTFLVVAIFYYTDSHLTAPLWLDIDIWSYIMLSTIAFILIKNLLYHSHRPIGHIMRLESWVSFGSVSLAACIPFIHPLVETQEWPRHVATLAVLLAWTELMFLLSRFPNWGYYVLMFSKVARNVIKILLTFGFLVIGFSLSFMIQFRSQVPFDGPWPSLVKTIVMMTSEFEYDAQFDEEHTQNLSLSLLFVRIVFVAFVILAAIVLMNLMVGVAVSDINDLEILGNIQRLAKQVDFLGTLDVLVYNKIFSTIFPKSFQKSIRGKRNVATILTIHPGRSRWRRGTNIPRKIKDAIFAKATKQRLINDEAMFMKNFSKQLDEIHEVTVKRLKKSERKDQSKPREEREDILKLVNDLSGAITEAQHKLADYGQETKLRDMDRKLEQMNKDIEQWRRLLSAAQGSQTLPPEAS